MAFFVATAGIRREKNQEDFNAFENSFSRSNIWEVSIREDYGESKIRDDLSIPW
jgi:hypothetical protein